MDRQQKKETWLILTTAVSQDDRATHRNSVALHVRAILVCLFPGPAMAQAVR